MIWDALISAAVVEERPLKTTAIQATMGSIYNHWVLHRFLVQDRPSASKNRGRGARKGTEHNNRLFYAVVKLYDEWIAQCELCTLLGTWNVPFEKIGAKSVLDKDLRVRCQKKTDEALGIRVGRDENCSARWYVLLSVFLSHMLETEAQVPVQQGSTLVTGMGPTRVNATAATAAAHPHPEGSTTPAFVRPHTGTQSTMLYARLIRQGSHHRSSCRCRVAEQHPPRTRR